MNVVHRTSKSNPRKRRFRSQAEIVSELSRRALYDLLQRQGRLMTALYRAKFQGADQSLIQRELSLVIRELRGIGLNQFGVPIRKSHGGRAVFRAVRRPAPARRPALAQVRRAPRARQHRAVSSRPTSTAPPGNSEGPSTSGSDDPDPLPCVTILQNNIGQQAKGGIYAA